MVRHGSRWIALLSIALVVTLGFASQTLGQGATDRSNLRFVVVTHGQASDPYWSVVQNGVNQAAEDMGVEVEYEAPRTFDMVQMAQLIDAAVASQPDGMAISIPDADALGDSIRAGVAAGIPMISLDSGSGPARCQSLMLSAASFGVTQKPSSPSMAASTSSHSAHGSSAAGSSLNALARSLAIWSVSSPSASVSGARQGKSHHRRTSARLR